jgi:hypothetical protein
MDTLQIIELLRELLARVEALENPPAPPSE